MSSENLGISREVWLQDEQRIVAATIGERVMIRRRSGQMGREACPRQTADSRTRFEKKGADEGRNFPFALQSNRDCSKRLGTSLLLLRAFDIRNRRCRQGTRTWLGVFVGAGDGKFQGVRLFLDFKKPAGLSFLIAQDAVRSEVFGS